MRQRSTLGDRSLILFYSCFTFPLSLSLSLTLYYVSCDNTRWRRLLLVSVSPEEKLALRHWIIISVACTDAKFVSLIEVDR